MIDDDHRAIRQIADGLMGIAAFLDQRQLRFVADREHGAHRARQVEEIERGDILQAGERAQIGVGGEQAGIEQSGELQSAGCRRTSGASPSLS